MRTEFKNADEAYNYFLDKILTDGINFGDTKALFNVGFQATDNINHAGLLTDNKTMYTIQIDMVK